MISGNDHYYDDNVDQNEQDGDKMMIILTVMIKGCDVGIGYDSTLRWEMILCVGIG